MKLTLFILFLGFCAQATAGFNPGDWAPAFNKRTPSELTAILDRTTRPTVAQTREIMHLIEDHAKEAGIPVRFAASKLAENDELVLEKLKLSQNEKELLEHINLQLEEECKVDRSSAVAGMRFNYIQRACEDTVLKPHESRERVRSRKIDQVLTGKYTGIPAER